MNKEKKNKRVRWPCQKNRVRNLRVYNRHTIIPQMKVKKQYIRWSRYLFSMLKYKLKSLQILLDS